MGTQEKAARYLPDMTMTFAEKDIKQLEDENNTIAGKQKELFEGYLGREYNNARAKEIAHQGFLRRISVLKRCIENVFRLLPPNLIEPPEDETRYDAQINIQAFVFNVFGATDNLAWIWVLEKSILKKNGRPIPNSQIGLRKDNEAVRQSFSSEFQELLAQRDEWFSYLEGFRHSLAHRVPLYIPPYVVMTKNQKAYENLENRMIEALRRIDLREYQRLTDEQKTLTSFRPWMQQSFQEESRPMVFHPQLQADFNTVHELGLRILEELGN